MSETIGETIVPGTYIDVRAEGLIGVSGIATGNVGVIGTADRGPLDEVIVLGSPSDARETFGLPDRWPDSPSGGHPLSLTRTIEQLFAGGASSVYAVRVAHLAADADLPSVHLGVLSATDAELFTLSAKTPGTWANEIKAKLVVPDAGDPSLTLEYKRRKETFTGADAGKLAAAINSGSALIAASAPASATVAAIVPAKLSTVTKVDSNGEAVTASEVATALELFTRQPINLLVVGGLTAGDSGVAAAITNHLDSTETDGRERIAVLGVGNDSATAIAADSSRPSNARVVLVTPGIKAVDDGRLVSLPASYAAAVVAGRLAGIAPHVSLTNKDIGVADLTRDYSRAEQKLLLLGNLLVLHKNLGIRVLKGITTDSGAFKQISVRRIVDYAKEGVRQGANPYIGRLNNERVRAALKATLDGFLSSMVLGEMLTAYKLDVSATRAEEIRGECIVAMTLMPTFSIDYIKVIMNLS